VTTLSPPPRQAQVTSHALTARGLWQHASTYRARQVALLAHCRRMDEEYRRPRYAKAWIAEVDSSLADPSSSLWGWNSRGPCRLPVNPPVIVSIKFCTLGNQEQN
jgi:hypothetical protein